MRIYQRYRLVLYHEKVSESLDMKGLVEAPIEASFVVDEVLSAYFSKREIVTRVFDMLREKMLKFIGEEE